MYKTLIITEDDKLLKEIKKLDIWGDETGFEISCEAKGATDIINEAEERNFELIILQIPKENAQNTLNMIKKNLCRNIIIVGNELSLGDARFSVINNASDYFIIPFDEDEFIKTLERIRLEKLSYTDNINIYANELAASLNAHNENFVSHANDIIDILYEQIKDNNIADKAAKILLEKTTEKVFDSNEWLDLYINSENISENRGDMNTRSLVMTAFERFSSDFMELSPNVRNDRIISVILYILNNPESNIKQKEISEKFYMNSSYLSTIFTANTGQRFIDYITNVKLRRAAWLLRNTALKIVDIAEKLDYKDMGYFSRIFKKKYGVLPSDYRVPDSYIYFI
ncbi:MAG: helix-turn-helix domain-containing protein [Firmicutes bacterium]|nr:helix-turn-helix domain-containing protein [Bacillota bacterium]